MRQIRLFIAIMMMTMLTVIISAQGAPDQINAALADLSGRVGTTLQLTDLANWTWSQETFSDASLGCPQEGQMYAQVVTPGYIFLFTYQGVTYEYHTSQDGSTVILCETNDPNAPTPTPPVEEQYSNPLCPSLQAGEAPYMRSRLAIDMQAQVPQGSVSNLRDAPSINANVIGQIPGGALFEVVGGPVCADNILWWQVDYDGTRGIIAEGESGDYFVELVSPQPLPTLAPLTTDRAAQLIELSRLEGRFAQDVAWSPDGSTLAIPGGLGWDSLLLYSTQDITQPPRQLDGERPLETLAYRPDGTQIILGTGDGTVHLWNALPDGTLQERLFLQTHLGFVSALAFHPDNQRFAVAGDEALTSASVERANAVILWDINSVAQQAVLSGHTALVMDMAFSPDGSRLITAGQSDLRIWDVNNGQLLQTLESLQAISVEYSPNGQFIAVGMQEGASIPLVLLDANTLQVVASYTAQTSTIESLAFSPDSSLLASGGANGVVYLWSTQNDANLAILGATTNAMTDVAFNSTGTLLAGITDQNQVFLWGVPVPAN